MSCWNANEALPATVRQDSLAAQGKPALDERAVAAFKQPILEAYEREGSHYHSTARLWDDGILAPQESRQALALGVAASLNRPYVRQPFGVFRM